MSLKRLSDLPLYGDVTSLIKPKHEEWGKGVVFGGMLMKYGDGGRIRNIKISTVEKPWFMSTLALTLGWKTTVFHTQS